MKDVFKGKREKRVGEWELRAVMGRGGDSDSSGSSSSESSSEGYSSGTYFCGIPPGGIDDIVGWDNGGYSPPNTDSGGDSSSINWNAINGMAKLGQVDEAYRDWVKQDLAWRTLALGTTGETVNSWGCKLVGAAMVVSSALDKVVDPAMMVGSQVAGNDGLLTQGEVASALKGNSAAELNLTTKSVTGTQAIINELDNIVTDVDSTTYVLAKVEVGAGLGEHWVVLENFQRQPDGTVTYSVVGTSDNDVGRVFDSKEPGDSQKHGQVVAIETYRIAK